MAEAKFDRGSEKIHDVWFEGVTFEAAGRTAQENGETENEKLHGNLQRGFSGADIFVTEGKVSGTCNFGSCVLLQNPSTWGKEDTTMRRFIVTAAHCVSSFHFGKVKKVSQLRLRIPLLPWQDFPEDTQKYQAGIAETMHLYDSILVEKSQIFIHEKFDGNWNCGYDVALVAIPEMTPSAVASGLFFDIYDMDSFPDSISVNGYPIARDNKGKWNTHIPYCSKLGREDDEEEEWMLAIRKPTKKSKARMVDYPLATHPGISGGALIVDEIVIGIHNAKKSKTAGHGTIFTKELKSWMENIHSNWDTSLGQYFPPEKALSPTSLEDANLELKKLREELKQQREAMEQQKAELMKQMKQQKREQMEQHKAEMDRLTEEMDKQMMLQKRKMERQKVEEMKHQKAKIMEQVEREKQKEMESHKAEIYRLRADLMGQIERQKREMEVKLEEERRSFQSEMKTFNGGGRLSKVSPNDDVQKEEEVLAKKEIKFDFKEIARRPCIRTLKGHAYYIKTIHLGPEEKHLFSGSDDNKIIMWNMETYEKMKTFTGHTGRVNFITAMRNGFLLSGGNDALVKKWNIESGKCVQTEKFEYNLYSISITSDERIAAIAPSPKKTNATTSLVNIDTLVVSRTCKGGLHYITNDDKTIVAATNDSKSITVYQMSDLKVVNTIEYGSRIWKLVVNSCSSIVVTGTEGGEIVVWNVVDKSRLTTLKNAHSRVIYSLILTKDEQFLLSCSADKTVKMWSMNGFGCVATLTSQKFFCAALDNNNTRLYTGNTNGLIEVWYLRDVEEEND